MVYCFLVSLIPMVLHLFVKTNKSLQMLQQNWYNNDNRFIKWIVKNKDKVFLEVDMFFIIFVVALFTNATLSMVLFIVFYCFVAIMYHNKIKKEETKLNIVYTSRVKRLIVTISILYFIPIYVMVFTFDQVNIAYYYLIIGLLVYLNHIVVLIATYINIPIEKQVMNYYKNKAIRKLKQMSNLEVIGITGSYGKTSSKNILNDILNIKFNSFKTPKNFNTPVGLITTINNYLDKFSDYFIAEMGAFKRGEIKELCDLVHPKYGILTVIGDAHLESFKTIENTQKTKFELIESLPTDGIGVLNRDDVYQTSYELNNDCKIIWIGIDNKDADIYATNIKLNNDKTEFDCVFKEDGKTYPFETKLLGKANIYNILAGIALGKYFGLSLEQLQAGVRKVSPVSNRLEMKKYGNVNLIDDSYNSNPVGAKMALDVLDMMKGKKIVATPGMIELGSRQYEANLEFGKQIAKVADEVILVGKKQTKAIYEGLQIEDFKEDKIHIVNDVMEVFKLVNKLKDDNTYVLIENDLPDIFNER